MKNKRAYLVITSGGTKLNSKEDFLTPWLKFILNFFGIEKIDIICADQMSLDYEKSMKSAEEQIEKVKRIVADRDREYLLEKYIPGRELTVAVLNGRPLTVTDIVTEDWYNYDAKYKNGGSEHIVPADIPQEIFDLCINYAVTAHNTLGCRGITRSDFRWNEKNGKEGLYILELNTQPGMTKTSLVPEQAKYIGLDLQYICLELIKDASCNK